MIEYTQNFDPIKCIERANPQAVEKILINIENQAKAGSTGFQRSTGDYISKFFHRVEKRRLIEGYVGNTSDHAVYLEFGTSPHSIDSPVMIDGNWVYIKEHPGTRARPILRSAVDSVVKGDNYGKVFKETADSLFSSGFGRSREVIQ